MSESTTYQPVMADSAAKEGATATVASSGRPGLWTRITNRFPFLQHKRGVAIVVIAILVIIGGGLAGLAALPNRSGSSSGGGGSGNGAGDNPNAIQSDTHFYGQSPAVEPSRKFLSSMNEWVLPFCAAQKIRAADISPVHSQHYWTWVLGDFSFARTGDGFKHDPG